MTVTPAGFLGLPEPMQAAYVGGVLDGMSFTDPAFDHAPSGSTETFTAVVSFGRNHSPMTSQHTR